MQKCTFSGISSVSPLWDYIQDEKHVISSCMGTEQLLHQFNHLFDNTSDGDIKGFVSTKLRGLQIY
jgi:hypothetical protein